MNEFRGLYAQDFQKAWPQAYMLALHHVGVLQENAEQQMASATRQVLYVQRTVQEAIKELDASKSAVVEAIETASAEHLASVTNLSGSLAGELEVLIQRERSFWTCVVKERARLDQGRAELAKQQEQWRNRPLWKRLWQATFPPHVAISKHK
jgi:NifB/MoaA-like Fe-S oxidoreductase